MLIESRMFDMFKEELIWKIKCITPSDNINKEGEIRKVILNDILDILEKTEARKNEINKNRCKMMP